MATAGSVRPEVMWVYDIRLFHLGQGIVAERTLGPTLWRSVTKVFSTNAVLILVSYLVYRIGVSLIANLSQLRLHGYDLRMILDSEQRVFGPFTLHEPRDGPWTWCAKIRSGKRVVRPATSTNSARQPKIEAMSWCSPPCI